MPTATTPSATPVPEASLLPGSELPGVVDLGWYMSSFDLRSGLTVVELDFVETVPGALGDDGA